ncbi:MAG: metallophosphoesterase [Flavobacteriales bacterium]|nr:metallophosphoesterase [Flavobacteriales bacterium]
MKISTYLLLIVLAFSLSNCSHSGENSEPTTETEKIDTLFTFTFLGCNRVSYSDQKLPAATNSTTANVTALKRIFNKIGGESHKPDLFFFLGDMVMAENDSIALDTQLIAWVEQYNDPAFSKMAKAGIEMVAIPGNHEILYFDTENHGEYPLKGATETWIKHMSKYMPDDRKHVTGADSVVNQMTFSFVRNNVAFVMMNTDTYNEGTKLNPLGLEGQIPTDWIIKKVQHYSTQPGVDHIFVMGHKPYYINCKGFTGHAGFPEGPKLWPAIDKAGAVAMLSAHRHEYLRSQPGGKGTYQIIAGNGGSKGQATFFGYSTIHILSNGDVKLISEGFDIGNPYYAGVPNNLFTLRDSTTLTRTANANPYLGTDCTDTSKTVVLDTTAVKKTN